MNDQLKSLDQLAPVPPTVLEALTSFAREHPEAAAYLLSRQDRIEVNVTLHQLSHQSASADGSTTSWHSDTYSYGTLTDSISETTSHC
jgi:hypothetical protein